MSGLGRNALVILGLSFAISFFGAAFAGNPSDSAGVISPIQGLPADVLGLVLDRVPRSQLLEISKVSVQFRDGVRRTRAYQAHKVWMARVWPGYFAFETRFVTIPAGFLPDGTIIKKFGASRTPFLRTDWQYFMGEPPAAVPLAERATWFSDCPSCPVTHVTWENPDGSPGEVQVLVEVINFRLSSLGCIYDLPTDEYLHYLLRADVSGQNTDPYSLGVDETNADSLVLHSGNAQTDRIPTVGQKVFNAFGLQISGHVWKLTKTLFDLLHPELGHVMRGGSWKTSLESAKSEVKQASFGRASEASGFTLIRNCGSSEDAPLPAVAADPAVLAPPAVPRRRFKLRKLAATVLRKLRLIGSAYTEIQSH